MKNRFLITLVVLETMLLAWTWMPNNPVQAQASPGRLVERQVQALERIARTLEQRCR
jgi:hypothetical protein